MLSANEATFFLGAGASVSTGLPTAYSLIDELINGLIRKEWARDEIKRLARNNRDDMRDIYDFLRFENLLYWIKDIFKNNEFFQFLSSYQTPSSLQKSVASFACGGSLILTPNFDELLEQSFISCGMLPTTIDANAISPDDYNFCIGDVIKLHGSWKYHHDGLIEDATNPIHATMDVIIRESPGNMLKDSARAILKQAIDDKILVVIGYSASDALDIVPALYSCKAREVYWVDYKNETLREKDFNIHLLSKSDGTKLLPWEELLKHWCDSGIPITLFSGKAEDALVRLGIPQIVTTEIYDSTTWKIEIKKWVQDVRWHDASGLGLASELFGELDLLDKSYMAMRESRGKKNGQCGWSSARRLYEIAENTYMKGEVDFDAVIKLAIKAQHEAEKISDVYALYNALTLEGRCLFCKTDYDKAIELFQSPQFTHTPGAKQWNVRHNGYCDAWIGRSYLWSGNPQKAVRYLKAACKKLSSCGNIDGLSEAQFALGVSKMELGFLVEAREILKQNADVCRLHGLHIQRSFALAELNHVESLMGVFDNVEKNMEFLLSFFCNSGHAEVSDAYHMYADTQILLGNYVKALELLNNAISSTNDFTEIYLTEIKSKINICNLLLGNEIVHPDDSFSERTLLNACVDLKLHKASNSEINSLMRLSDMNAPQVISTAIICNRIGISNGKIIQLKNKAMKILHNNEITFWDDELQA